MNHTNSTIKNTVLARVHTIALLRSIAPAYAGSAAVLIAALYLLGKEVFVAQVFRNMPSLLDVGAVVRFFEFAFLNTHFTVQVISLAVFVAGVWLARETARLLSVVSLGIRLA